MENSTYNKLIKAAIEVMNEKGYHGLSIGTLANMVGISKSTVIHYFKTKEGILLAVLKNFLPAYMERFQPVLEDNSISGVTKLHRFIHSHMRMVAERRDVLSINIRDTKFLSGRNRVMYQNQQRLYEKQVVDIVKLIQQENEDLFKGLDPVITAKAIIGMCNHACIWYKEDDRCTMEQVAQHFFSVLNLPVSGLSKP